MIQHAGLLQKPCSWESPDRMGFILLVRNQRTHTPQAIRRVRAAGEEELGTSLVGFVLHVYAHFHLGRLGGEHAFVKGQARRHDESLAKLHL